MIECSVFGHLNKFVTSEWLICEEPFKWKRVFHTYSLYVLNQTQSFPSTNFGAPAKDNGNTYSSYCYERLSDVVHVKSMLQCEISPLTWEKLNAFSSRQQFALWLQASYSHFTISGLALLKGIHADVTVYIFAHLHAALSTEGNMLDMNWLQAAKELVKLNKWWNLSFKSFKISGWQKR